MMLNFFSWAYLPPAYTLPQNTSLIISYIFRVDCLLSNGYAPSERATNYVGEKWYDREKKNYINPQ